MGITELIIGGVLGGVSVYFFKEKMSNGQLENIKSKVDRLTKDVEDKDRIIKGLREENEKALSEQKNLRSQYDRTKIDAMDTSDELEDLREKAIKIQSENDTLKRELAEYKEALEIKREEIRRLKENGN